MSVIRPSSTYPYIPCTHPTTDPGWRFDGTLCKGIPEKDTPVGYVWECPLLATLQPQPKAVPPHSCSADERAEADAFTEHGRNDGEIAAAASPSTGRRRPAAKQGALVSASPPPLSSFFCISPDACTNPTLYWLGDLSTSTLTGRRRDPSFGGSDSAALPLHSPVFELGSALGPHRLDLGDILYAPNLVKDPQVRDDGSGELRNCIPCSFSPSPRQQPGPHRSSL